MVAATMRISKTEAGRLRLWAVADGLLASGTGALLPRNVNSCAAAGQVTATLFLDGRGRNSASPEYAEGLKIRARSRLHRRMICVEGAMDASPDNLLATGSRPQSEK
jgi:hypothetical protein